MSELILIKKILLDSKTQAKISTCDEAIESYAEKLENEVKLPAIDLFLPPGKSKYYVGDGWQRLDAHIEVGFLDIEANIHEGDLEDAIWYAIGANRTHGVPMSRKDKQNAVGIALSRDAWKNRSDTAIAKHVGVSQHTVTKLRKKMAKEEKKTPPKGGFAPQLRGSPSNTLNEEKPAETSGETDDEVPDFLKQTPPKIDIEPLAAPYQECHRLATNLKKIVKDLATDEKYGRHIAMAITRITTDIDAARGSIRQLEPMQPCEDCDGSGCDECLNTGYWTRIIQKDREQHL